MIRHYAKYRSAGRVISDSLDLTKVAGSPTVYPITLPVVRTSGQRVSSLIWHPYCAVATWTGKLYLYGARGDARLERNWCGPIAVSEFTTSDHGWTKRLAGSTDWFCAPSIQQDTQDYEQVAALVTISSTTGGFAGKGGIFFDADVQDAVSSG